MDLLEPGKYFHLYNRGVNKENIFYSEKNYSFFLFHLADYCRDKVDILAYCLMPNHFHIIIRVRSEDFLKKSLQPFLLTYSKSVNRDLNRVGPLFQGRYQVNPIEEDGYLLDCVKYLHLNPVKANLVDLPIKWKYSSYSTYLLGSQTTFVDTRTVMDYFGTVKEFQAFTEDGLM